MTSRNLLKVLVSPSKIAAALDWRKASGAAVLSLDIHQDRIGMAVASHPALPHEKNGGGYAQPLEPIQLEKKGRLPKGSKEYLEKIVKDYNVVGILVSWPLQQDTGRMGAGCGRTLHTIEDLMKDNSDIFTPNRPIALWDSMHPQQESTDDWGRCSCYGHAASDDDNYNNTDESNNASADSDEQQDIHYASIERYHHDEYIVATQVWDDFMKTHWPTIYEQTHHHHEGEEPPQEEADADQHDGHGQVCMA